MPLDAPSRRSRRRPPRSPSSPVDAARAHDTATGTAVLRPSCASPRHEPPTPFLLADVPVARAHPTTFGIETQPAVRHLRHTDGQRLRPSAWHTDA
ncbi:hypothetical protein JM654_18725 [Microbacterium oxydans]|nr:hypothetical protein [Microbacterium oxydans]